MPAPLSDPVRLTDNKYNDFSPSLYSIGKDIELVWQSNQSENWQVYYSADLKLTERISTSYQHYQPTIGYSNKTGKVIAWFDQKVDPPQIFAKFKPQRSHSHESGAPGNLLKAESNNPYLFRIDENLYLAFTNNLNLFLQK
jgi:hypothetical protein